jgi:repressor LexA
MEPEAAMSDRQKIILDFIRDFIGQHCYSPSIREICHGTGIKSTSHVTILLNQLQHAGYIQRDTYISRSIRLTEQAAVQAAVTEQV